MDMPDVAASQHYAVLALYQTLFLELNQASVEYCVWKNKNELTDAVSGKGDIDRAGPPETQWSLLLPAAVHGRQSHMMVDPLLPLACLLNTSKINEC